MSKGGFIRDEERELDAEEAFDEPHRGCDRERISENL
jgi:hypothetical protein